LTGVWKKEIPGRGNMHYPWTEYGLDPSSLACEAICREDKSLWSHNASKKVLKGLGKSTSKSSE
jgi:hypothetical protein